MGKNKRAAKAAWRAAAATTTPPAANTSPAHPLDTHAAAADAGELPAHRPQQPRESQIAPAAAAHSPPPPAPSLVTEPASPIADAASAVEDATHTRDEHAPNACATTREHEPPPARASTTGVQHEPPAVSTTPLSIRHDSHALHTQPTPPLTRPTPTTAAIAVLAACIHAAGPPDFVVTTPTHAFDDAFDDAYVDPPAPSGSTTSSAPATHTHDPPARLATTREEIHPDLLAMIMEDGRRIERRAARLQPRDEEWKAAYQQGWHEGYETGLDDGYSEVSPPPMSVRTDVGTQSDDPAPPLPTLASPHLPTPRVDAAVQAHTPPCPPRMRADPHIPSHASLAPKVAAAAIQTDDAIPPTRVDSPSQTVDPADTSCCAVPDSAMPTLVNDTICADLCPPTPAITRASHTPPCTILSTSPDDIPTLHASFTTHANDSAMAHTTFNSFSWADDATTLPVNNVTTATLLPTRDFSVLRTASSRPPFESLQRRARRSRVCPVRLARLQPPPLHQPLPVVTRCHPSGLRTGRPMVIIPSSPTPAPPPTSAVHHIAPLDWDADPRLCELSRVLQGLGWVRSGSG